MNDDTIEYFRRAIEHAPASPGALAPNLTGWTTPAGHYLCARCAGRIIARGCHLPRGAEPHWNDSTRGPCVCCAPAPEPIRVNLPFRYRGESPAEFAARMATGEPSARVAVELERSRNEEGAAEAAADVPEKTGEPR